MEDLLRGDRVITIHSLLSSPFGLREHRGRVLLNSVRPAFKFVKPAYVRIQGSSSSQDDRGICATIADDSDITPRTAGPLISGEGVKSQWKTVASAIAEKQGEDTALSFRWPLSLEERTEIKGLSNPAQLRKMPLIQKLLHGGEANFHVLLIERPPAGTSLIAQLNTLFNRRVSGVGILPLIPSEVVPLRQLFGQVLPLKMS
ncbi:hypothetical protein Q1695_000854 [Nippostrongylus brasiliensis]|nr:hypothetical protein Q1695_000854 [Nippostrongylus brasiliensis]